MDTSANTFIPTAAGRQFSTIDWVAFALLVIGGLNWGSVGLFNLDLVASIFGPGSTLSRIVYGLVGIAALWGIMMAVRFASGPKSNTLRSSL